MSVANYEKSCQKWSELTKKLFGTTSITWRLNVDEGRVYFSTNGIEQIKATVIFLATMKVSLDSTTWAWAWHGGKRRSLNLLNDENRITTEDIADCTKEGVEFEEPKLFESAKIVLTHTERGKYYIKYMKAKMLEILEGQFIYEADLGNGTIAVFVILAPKKIKQIVPENDEETKKSTEVPETSSKLETEDEQH